MKKYIPVTYFVIISVFILNIACQSPTQTDYAVSHIKGFILDTVTLAGLDSVTLSIPELNISTTSFSSGYYQFLNIHMPRDPINTVIVATRTGYQSISPDVVLRSNDTTIFNVMMYR